MDRGTDEMAVAQWGVELGTQTRLLVARYCSSRRLAKKKANNWRPRAVWSELWWVVGVTTAQAVRQTLQCSGGLGIGWQW
jgi:DNA-directed RNA polymerase subunit RPC12/RpoP